jgi:mono/diheme cytochrome c family protein
MSTFEPFYAFFARIGYTAPFHPPLTHMPIGLVVGALIFLAVGLVFNRPGLRATARHCLILAWLFIFPTVLLGVMDWQHFYHGAWLLPIKAKIGLAGALFVALSYALILIYQGEPAQKKLLVVNLLAFILVVALGYFGGSLVYGGREVAPAPTAATPAAPAPVPPAPGPAAPTPTELAAGKKLFEVNCAFCHPNGSNAIMPNLPLRGADDLKNFTTFLAFIRNPRLPDGSKGSMPAFSADAIPDQQARELYDYVSREFGPPEAK